MAKTKIEPQLNLVATADTRGIETFNAKLRETQKSLKRFQPLLTLAATGLYGVGTAALAAAKSSAQLAGEIKDMAERAGIGTTQMQVLGRVAAQSGSSMEEMNKAVLKLTKSTQEAANGNKGLSERFARLGIDVNRLKALSPERQMERLGLAVNAAKDRQAALAEVMALVGQDAGPKLMESLKKLGTEGFDELSRKAENSGHVLSEEAIKNLDRVTQAFKDLGYWIKVSVAEAIGGVIKLGETIAEVVKTSAQVSEAKFGLDNWATSEAYRVEAAQKLAEGDLQSARKSLEAAKVWIEAAQARYGAGKLTAKKDMALISLGAMGGDMTNAMLPYLQNIEEIEAKLADAETRAADHTGVVAEAAAEAQKTIKIAKQRQAHEVLLKEEAAFEKIRAGIRSKLEEEEEKAAEARWEAQRALVDDMRKAIAQVEWDKLAPSEQLRQQTEAFHSQAKQLYDTGHLGAEEWARAQDQVNEKLREASELLSAEQNAAAYESLSEQTKNLLDAFEGLDATIEGQLGNTLKDFVETGTADMKKLGQSIINEVIQAMLKALVLKPLLTGIGNMFGGAGGGAVGGIFAGIGKGLLGGLGGAAIPARASGGPVKGRSPYLVGERGPELFIPPSSGTIIDANKTAAALAGDTATSGERGPQNIYQIDARGADAGAVQRLEAALFKLAGPGQVEKRARAAEADRARRG